MIKISNWDQFAFREPQLVKSGAQYLSEWTYEGQLNEKFK